MEVEMVETGGHVHGVPAIFCYILPMGQVEYSRD